MYQDLRKTAGKLFDKYGYIINLLDDFLGHLCIKTCTLHILATPPPVSDYTGRWH